MGRVIFDKEKCVNCNSCILACSFHHKGEYNPFFARIKKVKETNSHNYVSICRQCSEQTCYNVCPSNAIHIDNQEKIPIVDEKKCTGCGICVKNCKYHGIFLNLIDKKALKCDLCIDNPPPICVEVCIPKALRYED